MEFPPTFVINLDERKDRWETIQKTFNDWPVSLERVSAIKASPGWKGCYGSHKRCVEIAKERNYPWVLILEDDCKLTETGAARFQSLLPHLWEIRNTWDIFNGGLGTINKIKKINDDPPLFQVEGFNTHFCLLNSKFYDTVLNFPEKPIDHLYGSENVQLSTRPHIAIQEPGKSDILDGEVDYMGGFSATEEMLEKEGFRIQANLDAFSVKVAIVCLGGAVLLHLLSK